MRFLKGRDALPQAESITRYDQVGPLVKTLETKYGSKIDEAIRGGTPHIAQAWNHLREIAHPGTIPLGGPELDNGIRFMVADLISVAQTGKITQVEESEA